MANCSTAYGTIEFSSKNKDVLEILYNSLHKMKGEFRTYFFNNFNKENIEMDEDRYRYYANFDATGRWTYLENIKSYSRWIELSEEEKTILKENEWMMKYNFTDHEIGMPELYDATVEVTHQENKDIEKLNIKEECTDYDVTWVSVVNLGFYESAQDYVYIKYDYEEDGFCGDVYAAEDFLKEFSENQAVLARYYKCDVNDIETILKKANLWEMYNDAKATIAQKEPSFSQDSR